MDPVTQGVLGAAAGQACSKPKTIAVATLVGAIGGMAPDLDILIRSATDPLLALEFHRQFTHSLIFIPAGALIMALLCFALFARHRLSFGLTYLFSLAGYATHALLDACTTYGTLLLWPFSDTRIAWNVVSVVDPLFTLPALTLVIATWLTRRRLFVFFAIGWMALYLTFGLVQNQRALIAAQAMATARGHEPLNLGVKPSFANLIVWKSVYEHEGNYYVDAIRVFGSSSVIPGSSTPKLDLARDFPWLREDSQQARDVERFRWFSNQHLGIDPENPGRIIDIRYSLIPNELSGMWGIELSPAAKINEHADYTVNRTRDGNAQEKLAQLWSMIVGETSD